MLQLILKRKDIDFIKLLDVYQDNTEKSGSWEAQFRAENRFREDLDNFFVTKDAFYALWVLEGCYVAALRAEPYKDGYLIAGLQTAAHARGKGYATNLLNEVVSYLKREGNFPVYSHVDKRNQPSLAVHKKCGFQVLYDYGVYLDGSVFLTSYTLVLK